MLALGCPFLNKLANDVYVPFQILRQVAVQLMHPVIGVAVPGLLKNGLEDLTLDIIREFLATVAPGEGEEWASLL